MRLQHVQRLAVDAVAATGEVSSGASREIGILAHATRNEEGDEAPDRCGLGTSRAEQRKRQGPCHAETSEQSASANRPHCAALSRSANAVELASWGSSAPTSLEAANCRYG